MQSITPFLMFVGEQDGRAEEAMELYVSLFDGSRILDIQRYGPGEEGTEGTVKRAMFSLNGEVLMAIDGGLEHAFTFTPAVSLSVQCEKAEEVDRLYETLSAGGSALMPLDSYPFAARFAWVEDRFGVSWQLSFQEPAEPA